MKPINNLIAEIIFELQRMDGSELRYLRRGITAGFGMPCPDYLESDSDQNMLRREMLRRGWVLSVKANPARKVGRTYTAVFVRGEAYFESTCPYENEAVCKAALLTVGISIPDSSDSKLLV